MQLKNETISQVMIRNSQATHSLARDVMRVNEYRLLVSTRAG